MSEVAPPHVRRRGQGTTTDMVRTLAVIVAAVGALLLLVPGSPPITQPGPDPLEAAAAASLELDIAAAAAAVTTLGQGWSVTFARVEVERDVAQWHVGYLSPDDRRVDVEQTATPTIAWLTRSRTPLAGSDAAVDLDEAMLDEQMLDEAMSSRPGALDVEVGGARWWQFTRDDGAWALARQIEDAPGSRASVLVVSVSSQRGSADRDTVARALAPPPTR